MIDTHEIFVMGDGGPEFKMEVNWKPDDKKTNKCQIVRFIFPDGQMTYVDRAKLHSVLFAIGKRSEQANLVPQKNQTVRTFETTVGVKAKRDIAKGEMINFPIKLNLPIGEEEVIARAPVPSALITPKH